MIFVVGGRGRLGRAIFDAFLSAPIISLTREIYEDWWKSDAPKKIHEFFKQFDLGKQSIVFITAGIIDPKAPALSHYRVNFLLPKHIIEGTKNLPLKSITFGTVMEYGLAGQNPYIKSKIALGNYILKTTSFNKNILHIRIHTLFGRGLPSSSMFLGQIYRSLVERSIFEMTEGRQLREYHHVDDDVTAICSLIKLNAFGCLDLNHGQPVSLRDLAKTVFANFNADNLLRIGARAEPITENYETIFDRPSILNNCHFRETLSAVTLYLKECLSLTDQVR